MDKMKKYIYLYHISCIFTGICIDKCYNYLQNKKLFKLPVFIDNINNKNINIQQKEINNNTIKNDTKRILTSDEINELFQQLITERILLDDKDRKTYIISNNK